MRPKNAASYSTPALSCAIDSSQNILCFCIKKSMMSQAPPVGQTSFFVNLEWISFDASKRYIQCVVFLRFSLRSQFEFVRLE